MVFATAVPKVNAATKLKNAAQMTATRGERTRVETTVAMEFAASWKPLRKSKLRATRTRMIAKLNIGETGLNQTAEGTEISEINLRSRLGWDTNACRRCGQQP